MLEKILFVSGDPNASLMMAIAFEELVRESSGQLSQSGIVAVSACVTQSEYLGQLCESDERNRLIRKRIEETFNVSVQERSSVCLEKIPPKEFDFQWVCCTEYGKRGVANRFSTIPATILKETVVVPLFPLEPNDSRKNAQNVLRRIQEVQQESLFTLASTGSK